MPRLIILLLLISEFACAAGEPFPIGAKSWGMGNAMVAVPHTQSFFNNSAGLSFLENNSASASYHSRFQIAGLQTVALSGNFITKKMALGVGVQQFGDKLYNEKQVGLALAKNTGRVSLSIKASLLQAAVENVATKSTLLTEFGVLAKLSSKINVGFHAYNLTGAKLFYSQHVPTVLRLGLAYSPIKQVLLATEAEKSLLFPMVYKFGLDYQLVSNIHIRTGLSSQQRTAHFGLGFQNKKYVFDYAFSSNQALGTSHHLTLTLKIGYEK